MLRNIRLALLILVIILGAFACIIAFKCSHLVVRESPPPPAFLLWTCIAFAAISAIFLGAFLLGTRRYGKKPFTREWSKDMALNFLSWFAAVYGILFFGILLTIAQKETGEAATLWALVGTVCASIIWTPGWFNTPRDTV